MRITHLEPSNYRQMPWKNGLGVTTELARFPQEEKLDWRVSMAAVREDGPFSTFPGCDRVIVTLEGVGMILKHLDTGTEAVLGLLEPWTFSGDWDTRCELRDGPIRDFNLIVRRAAFRSAVSALHVTRPQTIPLLADTTLLYCLSGAIVIKSTSPIVVNRDATLILEREKGEEPSIGLAGPDAIVIQVELVRST